MNQQQQILDIVYEVFERQIRLSNVVKFITRRELTHAAVASRPLQSIVYLNKMNMLNVIYTAVDELIAQGRITGYQTQAPGRVRSPYILLAVPQVDNLATSDNPLGAVQVTNGDDNPLGAEKAFG